VIDIIAIRDLRKTLLYKLPQRQSPHPSSKTPICTPVLNPDIGSLTIPKSSCSIHWQNNFSGRDYVSYFVIHPFRVLCCWLVFSLLKFVHSNTYQQLPSRFYLMHKKDVAKGQRHWKQDMLTPLDTAGKERGKDRLKVERLWIIRVMVKTRSWPLCFGRRHKSWSPEFDLNPT
jgi:hypothetical protein